MTVSFRVFGLPQSQGSVKGYVVNGRAHLTTTNRKLGDWRRLIADCAQPHAHLFDGPVEVSLWFYLPRPKSLGKRIALPAKRPDLDKLVRASFDALTGVMWNDDAQVTHLHAYKRYASDHYPPGVQVQIRETTAL